MRKRTQSGVTLLELLLAVTLVSLLSVGMLFTIRIGLQALDRVNTRFYAARKVVGAQRVLEQQIAGLMLTKGDCRASAVAPPTQLPFFQGEVDTMRFVSTYSLQEASRGVPKLLEFKVIPGEREGVRLVVNEMVYAGPKMLGFFCRGLVFDPGSQKQVPVFAPVSVGPQSFVLADQLAYCRFVYKFAPPAPEPERWISKWALADLPRAIRVEMASLRPDVSQLQLMTITAPVHVNRSPDFKYED